MKNILFINIVLIFILFNQNNVLAQDPTFTQFYSNKLYLNPAFAGFEQGMELSINYRDQWIPVGGEVAKFTTKSFSLGIEMPRFQSGLGLLFTENTEGGGLIKNQSAGIVYAFRTRFCEDQLRSPWELNFGLKLSKNWRSLSWEHLVFGDQLDAIYGIVRPQSGAVPLDPFAQEEHFDFDAGFVIDRDFKLSSSKMLRGSSLRLGMAFHHLPRPVSSPIGLNDTLGLRVTLHSTWAKSIGFGSSRAYDLAVLFKADWQEVSGGGNYWFRQVDIGAALNSNDVPGFFLGLFWHSTLPSRPKTSGESTEIPWLGNTDALTFLIGWELPLEDKSSTLSLGASYTLDYAGLGNHSGGIWEFSLKVNLKKASFHNCGPWHSGKGRQCPRF